MEKDINSTIQRELSIRSETIQRVYNFYKNYLLYVNRRYQRKLIWTIEEKKKFIDSLIKGYPVPLILLAETKNDERHVFETMVESKSALDSGDINQLEPKLSRKVCEIFASYVLPLSVYSFSEEKKVDEIFIRINSYGKHLSRQELRSAGTLGIFTDLVRQIASEIRTDVTSGDILNLNKMREISITNTGLDYGIPVDEIFWVKNNVITKEMVREARDEEIIADILAAMAFPEIPPTSSPILDEYYGLRESDRSNELGQALQRIGTETLSKQFLSIYNEIRTVLNISGKNFRELIFKDPAQRLPRYFQVVFLAMHKLLYKDNKQVHSYTELEKKLDGISDHIIIAEGGNWSAANKNDNVDAVAGIIQSCFKDKDVSDPAKFKWLTEFESLLMQSKTEQSLYDFKQGLTLLDGTNSFDQGSFSKIILTLTAMANNSAEAIGYVCIGVSDSSKDMERIERIYDIQCINYRGFYISGISHEIKFNHKDLDTFYRWLVQEIKKQPISAESKDIICRNIRIINYFDKDVLIFRIHAAKDPMIYNSKYYQRHGANVAEVPPEEYPNFFRRFK
ncbi:RNA-binding domain-containing protein [Paenibacillus sp. HJGM_3]|uniref:RNA-binding domain-containing protein n=1 Tax=Paenibacillus sp. HJGM_3 TaxID=3379816 RepID=UPI0038598DA8